MKLMLRFRARSTRERERVSQTERRQGRWPKGPDLMLTVTSVKAETMPSSVEDGARVKRLSEMYIRGSEQLSAKYCTRLHSVFLTRIF